MALAWVWLAVAALRGLRALPDLTQRPLPPDLPPAAESDLTVVVPACNEEAAIAATLRSLLATRGLRLQIVAVNDRSTDRTAAEMAAVQAEVGSTPHELAIMTVEALPEGWLGKPHAMALAAAHAKADWLLFTDGDVLFAPDALARALHHAKAEQADHLIVFPTLLVHSLPERAMQAALQVLATWGVRLWKISDPRARDFLGVGGFNLIRREAYEAVGGFESLRMEVLDDVRMGWKLKRAGFRVRVAYGPGLVSIRWLAGALSVIRLIEKNSFSATRFQPVLHVLGSFTLAAVALLPVADLAVGFNHWQGSLLAAAAGAVSALGILLSYRAHRQLTHAPAWLAVFFPPAIAVVAYAFFLSMMLALVRGGIIWRGTRYRLKALREHAGRW